MNIHNQISQKKSNQNKLPATKVKIFDVETMQKRKESAGQRSNVYQNMKLFLSYLEGTDGELELVPVYRSMLSNLMRLVLTFPNFGEVIEYYAHQIALQLLDEEAYFSVDPVLIAGSPGIGKTAFSNALTKVLNAPIDILSFSSATAGFVLSGSTPTWSEGKPGRIVELMAKTRVANPLIMIDEIDKVSGDIRYSPFGPLYQLLEDETAKNFTDEGLEIATDCRYINWAATANDLDFVPEPILSRFAIFHIETPTNKEMGKVIRSIYQNVLKNNRWGRYFSAELDKTVIEKIIEFNVSPRRIQKELKKACAKIAFDYALAKRRHKGLFKIMEKHIVIKSETKKMPIGFYQ